LVTQVLTNQDKYDVIFGFVIRFIGSLKYWWQSMIEQDQVQFLLSLDFSHAITLMYPFFIGKPTNLHELKMREFFQRKCCSLQKRHFDQYYQEMLKLFYGIGADPNLK